VLLPTFASAVPSKRNVTPRNDGFVDQLQVPGCGLLAQGHWYPAGTWAHVHGWTPVVYLYGVTC